MLTAPLSGYVFLLLLLWSRFLESALCGLPGTMVTSA